MLTVSPPPLAPSISSMTTQVGFPSDARPLPASIAFLILVDTVAADRSSEALISSVLYPACLATICASVVLPNPGGPDNSKIWRQLQLRGLWNTYPISRSTQRVGRDILLLVKVELALLRWVGAPENAFVPFLQPSDDVPMHSLRSAG